MILFELTKNLSKNKSPEDFCPIKFITTENEKKWLYSLWTSKLRLRSFSRDPFFAYSKYVTKKAPKIFMQNIPKNRKLYAPTSPNIRNILAIFPMFLLFWTLDPWPNLPVPLQNKEASNEWAAF